MNRWEKMNLRFVRLGFVLMLVAGIFDTAFAHENILSDSLRVDSNYFSRQESCPENFFWQTVVNKTSFYVRIFIDGKPFSTEIYSLSPKTRVVDKEFYHQATRCFPEGRHEVKIIAFVYEKVLFSKHGIIEILKAEREFYYDSAEIGRNAYSPFMEIEENNLSYVAVVSFKNVRHNSGIIFLILLLLFAVGATLLAITGLFRVFKSEQRE